MLHDANFEAAATGATITYHGGGEIKVNGDAGLLRSAIENVVRNAIFYSGQDGKIEVRLAKRNDAAVVSVRDNGPGVPEDALPLLFKPFYRVDDSRGTTPAAWAGTGHRSQRRGRPRRKRLRKQCVAAWPRSGTALAPVTPTPAATTQLRVPRWQQV